MIWPFGHSVQAGSSARAKGREPRRVANGTTPMVFLGVVCRRSGVDGLGSVGGMTSNFDLCRRGDFLDVRKFVCAGEVSWLHRAPPRETFSRARRRDR